ncbi:hypothetical protein [Shimazuella alba]|uniref:Uncharacterized protein n=1 Tax=Shimazuella alba TaxID=2690964 RepID=A0A6I4VYG8_9BACL|nr:hypothetical protein [Shimazuella alba]MXQ55005.1 hypothetical protein [Shimazuella alba]
MTSRKKLAQKIIEQIRNNLDQITDPNDAKMRTEVLDRLKSAGIIINMHSSRFLRISNRRRTGDEHYQVQMNMVRSWPVDEQMEYYLGAILNMMHYYDVSRQSLLRLVNDLNEVVIRSN